LRSGPDLSGPYKIRSAGSRAQRGFQPWKIVLALLSNISPERQIREVKRDSGRRVWESGRQASMVTRLEIRRIGTGVPYDMHVKRTLLLTAGLLVGLSLAACEQARIRQINADPGRYMNKEVAVVGHVTQSIGAFGKGIYQVDDGTGRLWVLANVRGVPSKGAKVGVKGYVRPTITFLGINYATVMEETGRRGE
jgi:hypothetical protein